MRRLSQASPHPQPLSQCAGRGERCRVARCHPGARMDVRTPSSVSGEGWGEGSPRSSGLRFLKQIPCHLYHFLWGDGGQAFVLRGADAAVAEAARDVVEEEAVGNAPRMPLFWRVGEGEEGDDRG